MKNMKHNAMQRTRRRGDLKKPDVQSPEAPDKKGGQCEMTLGSEKREHFRWMSQACFT